MLLAGLKNLRRSGRDVLAPASPLERGTSPTFPRYCQYEGGSEMLNLVRDDGPGFVMGSVLALLTFATIFLLTLSL